MFKTADVAVIPNVGRNFSLVPGRRKGGRTPILKVWSNRSQITDLAEQFVSISGPCLKSALEILMIKRINRSISQRQLDFLLQTPLSRALDCHACHLHPHIQYPCLQGNFYYQHRVGFYLDTDYANVSCNKILQVYLSTVNGLIQLRRPRSSKSI